MSHYFFVHSRDPISDKQAAHQFTLARQLIQSGNSVSIMLVQNAVSVARNGAFCSEFDGLKGSSIKIYADRFSMSQREIRSQCIKPSVQDANISIVIDAMLRGDKVIWH